MDASKLNPLYVPQVGGKHYQSLYQHWDLVQDIKAGYMEANATKYLTRCHKKNGEQDFKKAISYVEKLLIQVKAGKVSERTGFKFWLSMRLRRCSIGRGSSPSVATNWSAVERRIEYFFQENDIPLELKPMIRRIFLWKTQFDLEQILRELKEHQLSPVS